MILATTAVALITSLAALLMFTGISKLLDLDGFSTAIISFGIPVWSARPAGLIICIVEVWASALLIFMPSVFAGAVTAAFLFALFLVAMVSNLAIGRTPNCRCFGQASSEPISWQSISRAMVLFAFAAGLAWKAYIDPSFGVLALLASLDQGTIVALFAISILCGVVALLSWGMLQLFRQNGRMILRMEALENAHSKPVARRAPQEDSYSGSADQLAPQFELPNQDGRLVQLKDLLRARRPLMLVFVSQSCGPCHQLLPDVAYWQATRKADVEIVLITEKFQASGKDELEGFGTILLDKDRTIFKAYQISGTPSAVVVTSTGHFGSKVLLGPEAIRRHMTMTNGIAIQSGAAVATTSLTQSSQGEGFFVGKPFPILSLPNGAGELISTGAFTCNETVFLFWNPRCAHCERMTSHLLQWERNKKGHVPTFVIISSEPAGLGLRDTTVLLDAEFRLGRACGITGTPSALAIDQEGLVREAASVGAEAILAMLSRLYYVGTVTHGAVETVHTAIFS